MTQTCDLSEGIRLDWACSIQNVYQRAIGDLHDGDPAAAEAAVDRLTRELPPAADTAESLHLRRSAAMFLDRAAHVVHQRFHVCFAPRLCGASPPLQNEAMWMEAGMAIPQLLEGWLATYTEWFDRRHVLPPALRATRLIEEQFAEPLTVAALARASGCSRTTLSEQFAQFFGLSPSEYLARFRMRKGLQRLRTSGDSVDDVARHAGYQSVNKFYARMRGFTGLTPSQVRALDAAEFQRVIEEQLPLRVARCQTVPALQKTSHSCDR